MPFEALLGHTVTLVVRRFAVPGAFLAEKVPAPGPEDATILLVGIEIPEGTQEGGELRVFIYRDSEGRPLATTRTPKLELGQVAFLQVTATTEFGAFVDWGLPKELLVPFAEQTTEPRVGSRHAIALYLDSKRRLAGSMKVAGRFGGPRDGLRREEWVTGEAYRNDPDIGLFVIVERSFLGLVPASEPHSLARGESARFRITGIHPDGKVELSLRAHAYEELEADGQKILSLLARPGAPRLGDASSPEEIRSHLGLSKKAFKRAVGRLLKQRAVEIDAEGFLVRAGPPRA